MANTAIMSLYRSVVTMGLCIFIGFIRPISRCSSLRVWIWVINSRNKWVTIVNAFSNHIYISIEFFRHLCIHLISSSFDYLKSTYELGSNTRVLYPVDKSIHDREPYIKVTGTLGSSWLILFNIGR
ncbi:uncharacterized protein Smp_203570 [Schistosoma mansoni]|uniref:uncharacterized protein n=1 Tax=Schistosoma mansoni TaxID=6183 RepID=UPI00022DCB77|nr:uncharacterized protein Smp_203570 [Schistosoma mansoni]|eukprot:XP_018654634.1 uncharacterized protein Smp_203570 [Schistosoma mansoni]